MSKKLINPLCFLDICSQDFDSGKITYQGRILIEVKKDIVPKTAENFRALCTGERGIGCSGKPLHYKNNLFHRVIPNFCTQAGDITKADGTGGEHIYRSETMQDYFDDENFTLKHVNYCVAMANSGKNRNSSQFYIYNKPDAPHHLDGKHVVFGYVRFGFEIVDTINKMGGLDGDTTQHIYIARCGQLHPDQAEDLYALNQQAQIDKLILTSKEL